MLLLDHPDSRKLHDFGYGRCDGWEAEEMELHISGCPECCRALEQLPNDDFLDRLQSAAQSDFYESLHGGCEAEPASEASDFPTLGTPPELRDHPRYRILKPLGQGGMGHVYLAEHLVLNRTVALKVIRPTWVGRANGMERFRREMRAVARLAHPNIVAAYDAEPVGESAILAMEYVEGETLADYVNRLGPRPVDEAAGLMLQVAAGLQHAWERGLIHRDVKPQNIIRTPDGRVKVLDFGVAQCEQQSEPQTLGADVGWDTESEELTQPGTRVGTPEFMSPEQLRGEPVDIRTDIYGLGAVLSFLLMGKAASEKFRRHLAAGDTSRVADMLSGLNASIQNVLCRSLATSLVQRFATPAEFAQALAVLQPAGGGRRSGLGRWLLIALGGPILCLAGIAVFVTTDKGQVAIETDDPAVEIRVSQGGNVVTILDMQENQMATLSTGSYRLTVTRGDQVVEMDLPGTFTLRRGERRVFTISRQARTTAERSTAERSTPPSTADMSGTTPTAPSALPADGAGLAAAETGQDHGLRKLCTLTWPGAHVYHTAFSHDGSRVLGSGDSGIRIWDMQSGELLRELNGHDGYSQFAVFSPDDRYVVSGGWQDQTLIVWDADTGGELRRLTGHRGGVVRIAFSRDGKRIVSGSEDSTLRIWRLQDGQLLQTLSGHRGTCGGRFSPDGKQVLSFSHDGSVRLWGAESGEVLHTYVGHEGKLGGCAFGPGTGEVLAWGYDRTIRVWDIESEQELRKITLGADLAPYVRSVEVDPGLGLIVSCHGDPWLRVSSLKDGRLLAQCEVPPLSLKGFGLSDDGRFVAAGAHRGWLYVFELDKEVVER